jgi:curved DNA-binding protein CbpA
MVKSYYGVLGVARSATEEEIRRRFRKLALEKHPDRFLGPEKQRAEGEFQALTEAFNILTHAERRRLHDLDLNRGGGGAGRSGGRAAAADKGQLVRTFLARGVQAYKEGNFGAAADSFARATEVDPESPQAWYNLAQTCGRQDRLLQRAVAAAERACELEPMKPSYLKLAGRLLGRAGQSARARHHLEQALTWGGPDSEVEKALAELSQESRGRRGMFGKPT